MARQKPVYDVCVEVDTMTASTVPRIMARPKVLKPPPFKFLNTHTRRGAKWYRIRTYHVPVMEWIRSRPTEEWLEEHGRLDTAGYGIDGRKFTMCEQLYMIFALRWS